METKICSECKDKLPLDAFYNSYSYSAAEGKNKITGKRKQCKVCVGKAKNKPLLNAWVDIKPIGDPIVNAGLRAWGRRLDPDSDDR